MTAARHERLADGRARRPRAAAPVGFRLVAGARPRADRRAGHEARRDRDVGRVDRRARSTPRAAPRARRTAARRSSTSRSTRSGPVRVELPDRRRRRRFAARRPTPTRSRGRRARRRGRAPGAASPAATCTGRTPRSTLRAFAEAARVPVFVNGMGRGTLPADHELAFSRARSVALKEADLVLVAGTPLDFRLGFGRFGDAQVVHLCDAPSEVARARRRSRRRRRAISPRRSPRSPTSARRRARSRRLDRAAARRRAREARRRRKP